MMTGNIELEAFDPDQAEPADLRAWYELAMAVRKQEKPDREARPFDKWLADLRLPDAGYGPREFWGARRNGELVATVQVYLLPGESDQVALTSITVAPDGGARASAPPSCTCCSRCWRRAAGRSSRAGTWHRMAAGTAGRPPSACAPPSRWWSSGWTWRTSIH
jgi:hypothetical protein